MFRDKSFDDSVTLSTFRTKQIIFYIKISNTEVEKAYHLQNTKSENDLKPRRYNHGKKNARKKI